MNQSDNKLIAEWAGFRLVKIPVYSVDGTVGGYHHDWFYPNGNRNNLELPDLTSLDALFKWVVPKAIDTIASEYECDSDLAYAMLFKWWLQKAENSMVNAEALAQAVLKLIKRE